MPERDSKRGAALLAVDVGNSDTVVGLFGGEALRGFWRLTSRPMTADEARLRIEQLARSLDPAEPPPADGAVLCSVVPALTLPSAEELLRRAARIPRVELRRPERALGQTTEESLRAGVLWGAAGQVDALVRRLAREMNGTPQVIATGGWAKIVAGECETVQQVDEALTLKGMRILWEEQV